MKNLVLSSQSLVDKFNLTPTPGKLSTRPDLCETLLTGGAGFLGLHLLDRLVNISSCQKIYLPIRSLSKFKNNKKNLKLDFPEDKIIFIESDLLNDRLYDKLRSTHVIHCAAHVHNLKSADVLFDNNVSISKKIYNYALDNNSSVTLISTLSLFVSSSLIGDHPPVPLPPLDGYFLYGGYAQTKWMSEYIAPLNTQIIRLGLLTPSMTTNIHPDGFFKKFIVLNKLLGCYPEGYQESFVDVTPVNLAAEEIINSLLYNNNNNRDNSPHKNIIHVANKKSASINDFIKLLSLSPMPKEEYLKNIYEENFLNRADQVLLHYAWFKSEAKKIYPDFYNIDLFQATGHNLNGNIDISNSHILEGYLEKI